MNPLVHSRHDGDVSLSIFITSETSSLVRDRGLVGSRSFVLFQADRFAGKKSVPGETCIKRRSVVRGRARAASLPGNLLVMLISTYKPFIIADEQLIRSCLSCLASANALWISLTRYGCCVHEAAYQSRLIGFFLFYLLSPSLLSSLRFTRDDKTCARRRRAF